MNEKQKRFAREYIVDLNATQAAIRAGYSPRTANEQGTRLLANAGMKAFVVALMEKREQKTEIVAERVLLEMARAAFYDPADIANQPMSGPADIAKLPEAVRRAIVGWGWDKAGNFTLKLADKLRALEMLGRHLSLFNDKVNVTVTHTIVERLDTAIARLERPTITVN